VRYTRELQDPPAPISRGGLYSAACTFLLPSACTQRHMTLCAARRLHLAKFERAVLALLLASNALAAAPDWADSEKPSEAAVDVSPPPHPHPHL
jgi:hypothetical protein